MGLHIIAYRIVGVDEDEGWGGRKIKFLKTEEYRAFDSVRHSGDREFAALEFVKHPDDGDDFEERYYRPKDIVAAKEWVKTTDQMPDFNRPRLLKLLEDMEADPTIYLYFSW